MLTIVRLLCLPVLCQTIVRPNRQAPSAARPINTSRRACDRGRASPPALHPGRPDRCRLRGALPQSHEQMPPLRPKARRCSCSPHNRAASDRSREGRERRSRTATPDGRSLLRKGGRQTEISFSMARAASNVRHWSTLRGPSTQADAYTSTWQPAEAAARASSGNRKS